MVPLFYIYLVFGVFVICIQIIRPYLNIEEISQSATSNSLVFLYEPILISLGMVLTPVLIFYLPYYWANRRDRENIYREDFELHPQSVESFLAMVCRMETNYGIIYLIKTVIQLNLIATSSENALLLRNFLLYYKSKHITEYKLSVVNIINLIFLTRTVNRFNSLIEIVMGTKN